MKKLAKKELKAVKSGGGVCTAKIEYRHSNHSAFTRIVAVDNCSNTNALTGDGGVVISCTCS